MISSMMWDDETGIGTADGILSAEKCAEHIGRAERAGFDAAPIVTAFAEAVRDDVRNNSRVMVDDAELAARLWARAAEHVPVFSSSRPQKGAGTTRSTNSFRST